MSWLSKTLKKAERSIRRHIIRPLLNVATGGMYGHLKYGKLGSSHAEDIPMPAVHEEPLPAEIVSEEVQTEEMKRRRRARGRGRTVLTGELETVPFSQVGTKTLLGG